MFGKIVVGTVTRVWKRDGVVVAVKSQYYCINNDEWSKVIKVHQGAKCRLYFDIVCQIVGSSYLNEVSLAAFISFPLLTSTLYPLAVAFSNDP